MRKEDFCEALREYAESRGPIRVGPILKGDSSYTGLCLNLPGTPCPVVDLDTLFLMFDSGRCDLEACYYIVDKVLDSSIPDEATAAAQVKNWDWAKSRLFLRPFDKCPSEVYRQLGVDMYVCPYVALTPDREYVTHVTPELCELWGIDSQDVIDIAVENDLKDFARLIKSKLI